MRIFDRNVAELTPFAFVFSGLFAALSLAGCPFAGPVAEFSATPTEGDAPLTVRFTDLSEPGGADIESWRWDFGDGTQSVDENPVHVFPVQGRYRISLTVSNGRGSSTETKDSFINVQARPSAAFSASPRAGNSPLSVQFLDESDGGPFDITAWRWTFGDGESSEEQDPLHVYEQPGAYTVSLTVTSAGGSDTETRAGFVQIGALPTPSFEASPLRGPAPLDVQFTDTSIPGGSPIESWDWSFGDGASSSEQNPLHRYAATGAYTVTLIARNAAGEATTTRSNLIAVTAGPVAAFRASPVQGAAPLAVTFTDESIPGTSPIASWLWDFGDGTSSAQRNPVHEFASPGQYDISLTVTTDAGSDTILKSKFVTAQAPPVSAFTASVTRGSAPLTVEFQDISTPGASPITGRQWNFGDGTFSGDANPVHVYTSPGMYPVSLTVQTAVGDDTLLRETYIEVVATPTASFEAAPVEGEGPLSVVFSDTSTPGTQPISAWLWEFGDGTTSTEQNPVRVYPNPGVYTVSLTVTTGEGQNTTTRQELIRVFKRANADFTADIAAGAAPLAVQFRDASDPGSVGITGRAWDFGDGATSTAEDPLHTYPQPGTYTVSLTLSTPVGPNSERKVGFIQVMPAVSFSRTPGTGVAPLTVGFTDNTNPAPLAITAWAWDFGDGGTSTARNPSHTYTKAGSYDVRLTVTTEQGEATSVQTGAVRLRPNPAFSGTPLSGAGAPFAVQFEDLTDPGTLSIRSRDWNFGDGTHSTAQNPSHTFTSPGLYDVTLTVTTDLGNSATTKTGYVVVRPAAAFSATPLSGSDTLDVQFTDLTNPGSLEVLTWDWTFGDGGTSKLRNPAHTYEEPGTYTVSLTTLSTEGADTETKAGYILVAPEVAFRGNVTSGPAPLEVTFTDTTRTGTLATTARTWNFGEGEPSDEEAPVHTYAEPGLYDVSLTITNTQGTVTGTRTAYIEVAPLISVMADITPGSGSSSVAFTNDSDTGNLTGVAWLWNFGDGTTSTEASPTHVFATPGIFVVTLTITSAEGVTSTQTVATINVDPVVSFTATPTSGVAPLDVQFTDTSNIGGLTVSAIAWDFGDGGASAAADPLHTYNAAGTFTATLTLTTELGDFTSAAPAMIEVAPEPDFSGAPRSGPPPLDVTFTNTSNAGGATITGLDWDFGDGGTSTDMMPVHQYTTPGTYTVSLTLATSEGTEVSTKPDYIEVNPVPAFTADVTSGGAPLAVNFTNTTNLGVLTANAYTWDFGDGDTSTDESPSHNYSAAGTYTVTLTVTTSQGDATTTQVGLITVEPDVQFMASVTSGPAPLMVTFTDMTALGNLTVTDWVWDFDDGSGTITTQGGTVNHTYTTPGNYTPTLTLMTAGGNFSATLGSEIVVNPVPAFGADLRSGPGVLTVMFTDDTASGNVAVSSRTWAWGDGTANTTTNNPTVSHTFAAPGTYDVSMTINTATQGSLTATETGFITVNPLTFTINGGLSGTVPHNVSVSNTTAAGDLAINGTQWDYGDSTGQTASTSHTYTTPGSYLISMIVTTAQGNRSVTSATPVVVSPVIAHSADITSGPAVVDVTFTDNTSTGGVSVTSRTWDFGDGSMITIPAPTTTATHQYTNTGTSALVRAATVTLNTTIGNFTSTAPVNITIHPISFSGDTTNQTPPLLVNFTDVTNTGALSITSRSWDFRDGGSAVSVGTMASRTYTLAGSYDVELTITTSQGNMATGSLATPVLVRPVVEYYETSTVIGPRPHTVNFEDFTNPGNLTGVQRRWTWGDGTTTTLSGKATSHTFTNAGCYDVTMELVTNEGTFADNTFAVRVTAQEVSSLTPGTSPDNGQAGVIFDLEALKNLRVISMDIHFNSTGQAATMRRYIRGTSAFGFEASPIGWGLIDQLAITTGTPATINFADIDFVTGDRFGFYLLTIGGQTLRYQTASVFGASEHDGNLRIYHNAGKSTGSMNDFDGGTFLPRWFVGSVTYVHELVCNLKSGGIAVQPNVITSGIAGGTSDAGVQPTLDDEAIATKTRDGGWAAIGHYSATGTESETPLLIRTDGDGAVIWELDLGGFAFDEVTGIRALSSGDFVLSGPTSLNGMADELLLVRLDAAGNMVWEQVIEEHAAPDLMSLTEGPAGGLLVLMGADDSEGYTVPVLYGIDAYSNILWRTELPATGNRENWGVFQRGDGVITVHGSLSGETDDSQIWQVHLDANGSMLVEE